MARRARRPAAYRGVACPLCKRPLSHEELSSGMQACPHCRGMFEAVRFTPAEARVVVAEVGGAGPDGATPCSRHERNAAVAACGRCGSFMCELCRIEADGKVLCPPCFDRLSAEGALPSTTTTFRDHGSMAQSYAAVGILFWILAPVLGPAAVYHGVKGLRQKRRMGDAHGVIGTYVAIVLGALEGAASVFGLLAIAGVFD